MIGVIGSVLIVLQLSMAGIIILLLDELLQKGYGLGNAINLFIAANVFGCILWENLSFMSVRSPDGQDEFEGAIVFFLHALIIRPNKMQGLTDAFVRGYGPNLLNLLSTLIIGFAMNLFQNFRVELNLTSQRVRNHTPVYPIRLIYTSNIPVLMQTAIVQVIYFIS